MPVVTDLPQGEYLQNIMNSKECQYQTPPTVVSDRENAITTTTTSSDEDNASEEDEESGSVYSDADLELFSQDENTEDSPSGGDSEESVAEAVNTHLQNNTESSEMCAHDVHQISDEEKSCDNVCKKRTQTVSNDENDGDDFIYDFLDKCNDNAEARLAARRQARAEAREIRMRELERQQREQEENADRVYDMYTDPVTRGAATTRLATGTRTNMLSNSSYHSSRRSSEDSLEDGGSLRDVKHELRELEEKFRKAMIANAQLDNDKASFTYQIELLKDRLEDLEQDHSQLQREHRDKCREHEQLKRAATKLKEDLTYVLAQLEERDMLIAEKGLVIVGCEENGERIEPGAGGDIGDVNIVKTPKKALVCMESAELLESAGEGSLDVRLKKFSEEKKDLEDQLRSLRIELDEERNKSRRRRPSNNTALIGNSITHNGPEIELLDNVDVIEVQREANKQLADYKFKLQKAEQDVVSLQGAVARLESQVVRYRAAAEASERAEDELKVEKRKLQRESRESQSRVEELETANSHLQKRLDKLKNAKSTLLKEL